MEGGLVNKIRNRPEEKTGQLLNEKNGILEGGLVNKIRNRPEEKTGQLLKEEKIENYEQERN